MEKTRRPILTEDKFFAENQVSWAAIEATRDYPPILSQIGILFLFLFFAAVGVYSVKTQVPVIIEGQGKIVSDSPPVPIRSAATFTVDQVLVKENDVVKKGMILANSVENLKPEDMTRLKSYLESVEQINKKPSEDLCLSCEPVLDRLAQDYLSIRAQGELINLISPMNDQVRHLKQLIESYNDIEKGLVATRLQIKNANRKLDEIKKRKAEAILAKEVEELQSSIVGAQTAIGEKFRSAATQLREARAALKSRTKDLNERLEQFGKSYQVVSPIEGKVINLKLKGVGELVNAGQILMDIVPSGTALQASIDILNKDIANIKVGDDVIISIDSMPELDYGTMNGTIKEILQVESREDGPQHTDRGFRALVNFEKQEMTRGDQVKPLLLAMTLRGRVVIRYESLARSIYRVLFKVKDDFQVTK